MIPLRDVMPSARTPIVTVTLIVAHAALWFAGSTPLADGWRHATWLHLGANLWCLWIFGDNVEGRIGRVPFLGAYLVLGAGALLVEHALIPPGDPRLAAASGATAGVMGIYFALYPRARVLALVPSLSGWDLLELPAAALLAVWFTIQLLALNVLTGVGAPALVAIAATFTAGAAGGALIGRGRQYPSW
jgi:membrane associated rhomboid family serine protease